ncbi:hypothetical protein TraAM80_06786 [Trypanosoma rangeli]|uniref:Uncharacterized protein n=1 Tax=Trypanosoma rangeli TaxID=5698 RepID=A0A3R7NFA9_TRYRA|nr:uncharacterized protein TraAM80_06786 [Trypanosoma rangeli]RNF01848.1 hypothetical protein TraAM80_06786 [Trypanosoma rangeli]|eukprot:RNF01848.1 hypothetical protein TraAM80_06786 [Trypanosoma rangeli]
MHQLELESNNHPLFQVPSFMGSEDVDDTHSNSSDIPSYQHSEMSIVPGMTTAQLLRSHRWTLSHMRSGCHKNGDENLYSLTLSRRHLLIPKEYESMVIDGVLEALENYSFGVVENAKTKKR